MRMAEEVFVKCEICGESFDNYPSLVAHLYEHAKKQQIRVTEFYPILIEVPEQSLCMTKKEIHIVVNSLYPNIRALCSSAIENYRLNNPLFLLRLVKLEEKYLWDLFVVEEYSLLWIGGER